MTSKVNWSDVLMRRNSATVNRRKSIGLEWLADNLLALICFPPNGTVEADSVDRFTTLRRV